MKQRKYEIPALFLALALLLTACSGENTAATMHLVRTEGMVQVGNAEGKDVKISENLGLYSGYEVNTLAESYGWITLDDVKLAKMDESSDVEIRKKDKLLELYVRSGGLFFNVTEPLAEDEVMNIRTSTMAVGIRGTCGWVEVKDTDLMCVYLLKGKVECSIFDEDGSVLASETITAGQAATLVLDGDKASIVTAEFDTEKLPDFVKDALENPENWNIPGDADGKTKEPDQPELSDESGDSDETRTEASHAVDENGEIIHDIHVREEGGILYFSGIGIVNAEDYEGYTPVNVVVEEGITGIDEYAFELCQSLVSVTLPDSLISIGDGAFINCDSLASVTLPEGLQDLGHYAFAYCPNLVSSVTLPDGLENIGDFTFCGCALTSVTLPDGLVSIGDKAFSQCPLTSVTLPDSLTSIGVSAFSECALTSVILPDSIVSISDGAFSACTNLTSVTLSNRLVSIGSYAFMGCPLTSVTFPDSLAEIGEGAFSGCPLTSVVWPSSLESIGREAFRGCSLTSVTFPDNLKSIGDKAFFACMNLTSVTWSSNLESIGEEAFSGGCPLDSIILPDGLKSIGRAAFWGCDKATSVTLPASIESIGEDAIRVSTEGVTVRAPASLRDTVESWFYGYRYTTNVFEWY